MKREILKPASWPDDKAWLNLLAPLFMEDASKAECAAKLWNRLLIEIESGEEGATRVAWSLEDALRLTFPFTNMYRACMILFQVSLRDDIPHQPDTLATLTEAMRRTRIALECKSCEKQKARRKRSE